MSTAIERLRASKQELIQRDGEQGKADGRLWAENEASYEDLVRLSKEDPSQSDNPFKLLDLAVNPHKELTKKEVVEATINSETASDEYIAAFIKGAQGFFKEIRHKL
jgi:hypothetical protein